MTIRTRFGETLGDFELDVEFSFPERGVTALFGPSGCGKTSVLRCMAGLNRVGLGQFGVDGEVWQDDYKFVPPHKRDVGYVFQEASLFPHMNVRENLLFGAKRSRAKHSLVPFDELVGLLGLTEMLDRSPLKLSGGERQRVAIGRALLSSPKILLMDEPLSALDHKNKNEILPYLQKLHDTLSIPVVYVTHDPDEVARLADHLVVLDKGKVVASGPVTQTMSRMDVSVQQGEDLGVPIKAHVVEKDEDWHLARAEFVGGALWVRDTGFEIGQQIRLYVLARDVSLALSPAEDASFMNVMKATVTAMGDSNHPAVKVVRIQVGTTPLLARLTARSADALGLETRKEVWAQIKTVAVVD
ncbi:molybdenum ABC transporter ATP-binding protein [Magnetovibrio sp. PR-2]|uniref:molybdenum ABC transporter ATP-binding protein n=1 Tax=Magnetovibrio sp. PR-2 TaxID=3120356 RepID=UPI002FCDE396